MIKRFLLFAGDQYYPAGGWDDFRESFDTLEEALKAEAQATKSRWDWAHVIDTQTEYGEIL